jgi:hypothetical protein
MGWNGNFHHTPFGPESSADRVSPRFHHRGGLGGRTGEPSVGVAVRVKSNGVIRVAGVMISTIWKPPVGALKCGGRIRRRPAKPFLAPSPIAEPARLINAEPRPKPLFSLVFAFQQ